MLWKQNDIGNESSRQDTMNNDEASAERPQNADQDVNDENRQDIDFVYDDTDDYTAEIAELYSYTEEDEFSENKSLFYEEFHKHYGLGSKWIETKESERRAHISRLCDMLDVSQSSVRMRAARGMLYVLQGVFGECELEEDQVTWARYNVFLALDCGVLSVLVDLLLLEIRYEEWQHQNTGADSKQSAGNNDPVSAMRASLPQPLRSKPGPSSVGSNLELRVVLNSLYIVVETVRSYKAKHSARRPDPSAAAGRRGASNDTDTGGKESRQVQQWLRLADNLIEELNDSISSLGSVETAPNLMIVLFGMIHRFCSGLAPNFPMKKVLLLLWKTALLIMGPVSRLFEQKNFRRTALGLAPLTEDSQKIVQFMKASYLPSSPADLLEAAVAHQQQQQQGSGVGQLGLSRASRAGRMTVTGQGPRQGSLAGGRNKLLASSGNGASVGGGSEEDEQHRSFRHSLMLEPVLPAAAALSSGGTLVDSDGSNETVGGAAASCEDGGGADEEMNNDDEEETVIGMDEETITQDEDCLFDVDEDTMDNIPSANSCDNASGKQSPPSTSGGHFEAESGNIDIGGPNSGCDTPRPSSPTSSASVASNTSTVSSTGLHSFHDYRTLPWKPKVKARDLEMFMETVRSKFIGYPISSQDSVTLAGLPLPIQDAVRVLKSHLYVSIGEVQMKNENDIVQFPMSIGCKEKIEETAAERLYRNMLPMIPQYMIALLKILLAAAPTSKSKTESINILTEVVPDEIPTTIVQSMKLNYDVNRHKEIIVKAISALLLLLLKHFKLNHIYQFEYISQHLVFANCIPLVLKFFNQNILNYVQAKNSIPTIDFPSCVIGDNVEINAEALESSEQSCYCWRNLFSCINLLRILNMLTKWKHSRTMMMVVFKSPPILKRALKVRQAMMQLYVLKLLKSQTRYSGRQWRKTNMQIMSAIYQKVRHRLTDDWAYGNDVDARPWDFQAEECNLRSNVNRFNSRRYLGERLDSDIGTHWSSSVGGGTPLSHASRAAELRHIYSNVVLSSEFRDNYEHWLQQEVFTDNPINWDRVLMQH